MTAPSGTDEDRSRLLLAIAAAAFSVVGVAVVMLAGLVVLGFVVTRVIPWLVSGGSGGIGSVSVGLARAIVTVLMLVYVAAAGLVAVRVFRMVRAGDTAPAPSE
jgi:hypothetical protein